MVAFSFSELAGFFQGLAIANSVLAVFKPFLFLLVAGIVFYGISYWVDSYSAKEGIRGIADIFKIAFWFTYLVVVIAMLTMTGTFRMSVVPIVIDPTALFNDNIKVLTPDGQQVTLSTDKPYQTLEFQAPAYAVLFELPDAVEYSLFQTFTFSLDPTKWGGYYANDVLDPNKLFTYCFAKESTEGDYTDAWKFLCETNGYATGLIKGTLETMGINVLMSAPIVSALTKEKAEEYLMSKNPDIDQLCKMINKGDAESFKIRLTSCFNHQIAMYLFSLKDKKKELQKLYAEGKISEGDYQRQIAQIDQSEDLAVKVKNSLQQSLPLYAKVFLNTTVKQAGDQINGMVQRTITTTGGSISESVKDLVAYFSQLAANAYVSERTMLRYYEAFVSFMLAIAVGIVIPIYLLLSALPNEKSIFGFNSKMLLYAVLIYAAIKWSRLGIALLYLIAHGIFLRSVY